jgi:transcriptional regulator with XRE-family HTH domain
MALSQQGEDPMFLIEERMEIEAPAAFGDLIKEYRLAAGLTQEVLAERAGVSTRSIQALERSKNRPQQETARRLAERWPWMSRIACAYCMPQRRFRGSVQPRERSRRPLSRPWLRRHLVHRQNYPMGYRPIQDLRAMIQN